MSLDETRPEDILSTLERMDEKPRVLTATISRVAMEEVQKSIRKLPVVTICVDEAQVHRQGNLTCNTNVIHHIRSSTQTQSLVGQVFCHMGMHQLLISIPHLIGSPSIHSTYRKDLWDWLAAAFPDAVYCLCSATLTDSAVTDMRGSVWK